MKNYPATSPAAQVPSGPNADLHNEAVRLMQQMKPNSKDETKALVTVKTYNQRRKEATKALRPILVKINDAFKRHETVGGCDGMKDWCEKVGTLTYARVRQIITGKSGNEKKVKSVDSLDLKAGKTVKIGKRLYTIVSAPEEEEDLQYTMVGRKRSGNYRLNMVVKPVEETPAPTEEEKKKAVLKRFRAAKKAVKPLNDEMSDIICRQENRLGKPEDRVITPEFQVKYDAAFAEFKAALEEGKALGILTTAPREKKHPAAKALAAAVDGAKLVHQTTPGGPKVLEVAIPGEFSSDPPRLKYYVCVGVQKYPYETLDAAKAACDKLPEQQLQKQSVRTQGVAQR